MTSQSHEFLLGLVELPADGDVTENRDRANYFSTHPHWSGDDTDREPCPVGPRLKEWFVARRGCTCLACGHCHLKRAFFSRQGLTVLATKLWDVIRVLAKYFAVTYTEHPCGLLVYNSYVDFVVHGHYALANRAEHSVALGHL